MKHIKKLTKKQRKEMFKKEKAAKTQHEHHHDMWCVTSYLQRKANRKHEKSHFREEKRSNKLVLLKLSRKEIKAIKSKKKDKQIHN